MLMTVKSKEVFYLIKNMIMSELSEDQRSACKFYRVALIFGYLMQIIGTGLIYWIFVCRFTGLKEVSQIVLAITAIVVLLFTTSVFISKAERDYEAKRNQRLAELRKSAENNVTDNTDKIPYEN